MALFHCWSLSSYNKPEARVGACSLRLRGSFYKSPKLYVTYIQQPSVAEDAKQRVDVTLAGEIQSCPYMPAWWQHTTGIPGKRGQTQMDETGCKQLSMKRQPSLFLFYFNVPNFVFKQKCAPTCIKQAYSGWSLLTDSSSWVLCRSSWIFLIRGRQ